METSGRQEQRLVIAIAFHQISAHAVSCGPSPRAFATQLIKLSLRWHAPLWAPVYRCRVVERGKLGLSIHKAIVAIFTACAVACHCSQAAIAPLIGIPVIDVVGHCLAPGEILPIFLGDACTNVPSCPQRAAWQSQVDILVAVVTAATGSISYHNLGPIGSTRPSCDFKMLIFLATKVSIKGATA